MSQPLPPTPNLAPRGQSSHRNPLVIAAGIGSTILALALVYLLQHNADTNVMGWYGDYVFPIGAILVGLVASSGYVLAAWLSGLKIRRGLLVAIVLLQIGAYFAAQYTEFAVRGPLVDAAGHAVSFPRYFHVMTVNTAWKDDQGKMGKPLGGLGYALRFGELAGFILGTLVSPVLLHAKPYCDACERYMQSKSLALLPASNTKAGHLFGKAAINRTAQEVLEAGMTDVAELVSLAAAADSPAFAAKLTLLAPQRGQAKKLSRRIDVRLVSCARCAAGRLEIQSTQVKGRQVTNTKMGQAELTPQFICDLRQQGRQ